MTAVLPVSPLSPFISTVLPRGFERPRSELVTGPSLEVVTLAEARKWIKVDTDDDDPVIDALVRSARLQVEEITGRSLLNQTWDIWLDQFPYCEIPIPRGKLQSVSFIKYIDSNGVQQTLSSSLYTVDGKRLPGRIVPSYGNVWPTARWQPNAVQVEVVVGEGTAVESVPQPLRDAVKVLAATLYDQREALSTESLSNVPLAFWQLVNPYRVWWL